MAFTKITRQLDSRPLETINLEFDLPSDLAAGNHTETLKAYDGAALVDTKVRNFNVAAASTVYILDNYPNAAIGLSLDQSSASYTGSSIRVRRSSDNTEQNIGFVDGLLDQSALLSFVGSGNGFVTTWYDQSGNGLNVSQSGAANQPQIVTSGAINLENGKPCITYNGSQYFDGGDILKVVSNPLISFTVARVDPSTTNFGAIYSKTKYSASNDRYAMYKSGGDITCMVGGLNSSILNSEAQSILTQEFVPNGQFTVYNNNVADTSVAAGGAIGFSSYKFLVGAYANPSGTTPPQAYLKGTMQNLIIYLSDVSAQRSAITEELNSKYSTY